MYLDPTDDSARALLGRGIPGPFLMLNLLRFRTWADYSEFPQQAPAVPISGRAAYDVYVEHTRPFLAATGGSVSLLADGGQYFIGPSDERWDVVMVVRQVAATRRAVVAVTASRCATRPARSTGSPLRETVGPDDRSRRSDGWHPHRHRA